MARLSPDGFKNFFKYFNDGVKQNEGLDALYDAMPKSLLEDDTTWIDLFRTPDPVKESKRRNTNRSNRFDLQRYEGFRAERLHTFGVAVNADHWLLAARFISMDYEDVALG